MQAGSGVEIDHPQAAAAAGQALGGQPLLQGQAGELGGAQLREPHHRIAPGKSQPPGEPRQGAKGAEGSILDPAQFAAAGIEQPQAPVVPSGRMGHRQPRGRQLTGGDVNQHTAVCAVMPPAGGAIATAAGAGPGGFTIEKGHPVEMAAIVAGQLRDEGWLPGRGEAAAGLDGSQAAEGRVHEQQLPAGGDHQLVGIHITGDQGDGGHVEAIAAPMELPSAQVVVESPQLAAASHPEALAVGEKAHRPIEQSLMQLERGGLRAVGLGGAEQHQAIGAVGGEGQRKLLGGQPGGKLRGSAGCQSVWR